MMGFMKQIDKKEFEKTIAMKVPVLIEFWSSSCIACDKAETFLKKLNEVYRSKVIIAKIDVLNNLDLVKKYDVLKVPTFILFKDSNELHRIVGFKNDVEFEKQIRPFIK